MSSSVCTAASTGTSGNFLIWVSSNLNWNFVPGKKKLIGIKLPYHKLKMSEIILPRWNWFARDFLSPDSSGPIQRVGANHRLALCEFAIEHDVFFKLHSTNLYLHVVLKKANNIEIIIVFSKRIDCDFPQF